MSCGKPSLKIFSASSKIFAIFLFTFLEITYIFRPSFGLKNCIKGCMGNIANHLRVLVLLLVSQFTLSSASAANICSKNFTTKKTKYKKFLLTEQQQSNKSSNLSSNLSDNQLSPVKTGKRVLIVDAFSSGNQLAAHLLKLGYKVDHMQSQSIRNAGPENNYKLLVEHSYRADDFGKNMVWRSEKINFPSLISKNKAKYDYVLAGSEPGVNLADLINHKLGLSYSNPLSSTLARRDKYEMQEKVRAAGLDSIRQMKTSNVEEAIAWAKKHNQWPIVVKPINSAATEGVFFPKNEEEIRAAFAQVGKVNGLGYVNHELLVQEFLSGIEYVVNTVSLDLNIKLTDIWEYTKTPLVNGTNFYSFDTLMDPAMPISKELFAYAKEVQKVLEIQNGPAHFEIMYVKGRGPVLIEVGSRLYGAGGPRIAELGSGRNQAKQMIMAFDKPEQFLEQSETYEPISNVKVIQLRTDVEGTFNEASLEQLRNLKSVVRISPDYHDGQNVPVTSNLFNSVGTVEISNTDRAQFEADFQRIMQFVRDAEFLR